MVGSKLPFKQRDNFCCFKEGGKYCLGKRQIGKFGNYWSKEMRKTFSSGRGIKSNGEDLLGKERMSLLTSSTLTNEK